MVQNFKDKDYYKKEIELIAYFIKEDAVEKEVVKVIDYNYEKLIEDINNDSIPRNLEKLIKISTEEYLKNQEVLTSLLNKDDDDYFYIAFGIGTNIGEYIDLIVASDTDLKYKLLSFRQLFIDANTEDKLDHLNKIGELTYGSSNYALLCSLIDNTPESIDPNYWKQMNVKLSMESTPLPHF